MAKQGGQTGQAAMRQQQPASWRETYRRAVNQTREQLAKSDVYLDVASPQQAIQILHEASRQLQREVNLISEQTGFQPGGKQQQQQQF